MNRQLLSGAEGDYRGQCASAGEGFWNWMNLQTNQDLAVALLAQRKGGVRLRLVEAKAGRSGRTGVVSLCRIFFRYYGFLAPKNLCASAAGTVRLKLMPSSVGGLSEGLHGKQKSDFPEEKSGPGRGNRMSYNWVQ